MTLLMTAAQFSALVMRCQRFHSEGRPGHLRRVKVSILRVFPETRLVALPGHIITFMVASLEFAWSFGSKTWTLSAGAVSQSNGMRSSSLSCKLDVKTQIIYIQTLIQCLGTRGSRR